MKDTFTIEQPFLLESGKLFHGLQLAYSMIGKANTTKTNIVWVFHALTGNQHPEDWWGGLVGEGKIIDPAKFCIICANIPGSCYGSSSPLHEDQKNSRPFFHEFPMFTVRDVAKCLDLLRIQLGISSICLGIGGSLGGQQLLEWAVLQPRLFLHIIPIATNARHSPWGIAFNTTQRMAIEQDPSWNEKNQNAGANGLKLARAIALLSYRHPDIYNKTQGGFSEDEEDFPIDKKNFKVSSYQKYQGEKLSKRFNAFSYYFLSKTMDSHDLGRERGGVENALHSIKAKTLVVGIDRDLLFPLEEQRFLQENIPAAKLEIIHSAYGHDGFLLEFAQIEHFINNFFHHF